MLRFKNSLALAVALVGNTVWSQSMPPETKAQKDQRMAWWRNARFGMFIHWGLYSIPAGKWGNETGYAEWIRDSAKIPVHEYEKFQAQFNPVKFDANQWAKMAKDAGMKYVVITTKHHDGFNLFDSPYTDWSVHNTPFKRDIMAEMAKAVRKQGLKIGWYHSIMDWHYPDYLPRRPWEVKDRPADGADFSKFVTYLRNDVSYLLTHYGPISVMWFDGEWESTWNNGYGQPLYNLCRQLQPNVIVNNRVSVGNVINDKGESEMVGDYGTPEQFIPATGIPGTDWETCMTMNGHWGYNAYDRDWKSPGQLVFNLVDIASKGGNYLLNIGPRADGTFPPEAVSRLKEIGRWMHGNGDSIYGTTASVFENLSWGRSTTKAIGADTMLYLHVFKWPTDGKLVVPGIGNQPMKAYVLNGHEKLPAKSDGTEISIDLSAVKPDPICTTVALEVSGKPLVYRTPSVSADSDQFVDHLTVNVDTGSPSLTAHYTLDGTAPIASSPKVDGSIDLTDTATVTVASFQGDRRVSGLTSKSFMKVAPWDALNFVASGSEGLRMTEAHGPFLKVSDVLAATQSDSSLVDGLGIAGSELSPEEHVGRIYTGYVNLPKTGLYSFHLSSDDGSQLEIDDHVVINNDGAHAPTLVSGSAPLAAGVHRVRVIWFNDTGGAQLSLTWGFAGDKPHAFTSADVIKAAQERSRSAKRSLIDLHQAR